MRKSWLFTLILSLSSLSLFSLPPGGLGPPGGGGDPDNDAVPIDGGISLLVAAGAALGGAKLFKKKAKEEA